LYGLAHLLVRRGWLDREFIDAHTTGFDDFAAHVAGFPPERVSRATGVSSEAIDRFAETIHAGERVSFWWTMGVNQSHEGTRAAQAISKVVVAVNREPARIALGSVAEVPLRARSAEASLARGDVAGAVAAVAADIRPIDDVRSTAEYRRTVAQNVLRHLLGD